IMVEVSIVQAAVVAKPLGQWLPRQRIAELRFAGVFGHQQLRPVGRESELGDLTGSELHLDDLWRLRQHATNPQSIIGYARAILLVEAEGGGKVWNGGQVVQRADRARAIGNIGAQLPLPGLQLEPTFTVEMIKDRRPNR